MQEQITLTKDSILTAIQGSENVIERIDYLKEVLEERRKYLEDEYMGCEEEYAIGDVMNLLDLVNNKFEDSIYDQSISTYFRGSTEEVFGFIEDLRTLLKRHVSIEFRKAENHESDYDNAWMIEASVSEKEIEEHSLEMDWIVFKMKTK